MDKKSKFINFVIDDLVNNTKIEYDGGNKKIYFPFLITPVLHIPFRTTPPPFPFFSKYCKDRYGLTGNDLDYVWEQYFTNIKDKITDKDNINESIEDKRDKFIEVIVDDLISKSRIDYGERVIYQPSGFYLSFRALDSRIRDNRITAPSSMKDYIRHHYQLNNEYTFKIFKLYLVTLKDKITDKGNINESIEDKKSRFINFVINDLVSDTIIDYDKDSIYFYVNHMPLPLSIFYTELTKQYSKFLYRPLPSFSDNCKDRYGLTKEEIKYVWDQYKIIIKDKITNK